MLSLIKLTEACCENNLDDVNELIQSDNVRANLNESIYKQVLSVRDDDNLVDRATVTHIACYKSTVDIVTVLIAHGARVDCTDEAGNLPIHYACYSQLDAYAKVQVLVEADKGMVYSQGHNCRTALHVACATGELDVVRLLLIEGAKPDVIDKHGDSPLHAVTRSAIDPLAKVMELLKHNKHCVNAQNSSKETALIAACKLSRYEVALMLLEHDADKLPEDENDKAAVDYLGWNEHEDNAIKTELYLKLGGITWDDPKNKSLLLDLSANTSDGVLECALRQGADVDVVDSAGETALHKAAMNAQTGNIDTLLNWGGDVNKQSNSGDTALHMASSKGLSDVVNVLTSHALADIFTRNANDQTPLDVALSKAPADADGEKYASIIRLLNDFVTNPDHLLATKLSRIDSNLHYLKRSLADAICKQSQSASDLESQNVRLRHHVARLEHQDRQRAVGLGKLEAEMEERIAHLESQNLRLKQEVAQQGNVEKHSVDAITKLEKEMIRLHNKTQHEMDTLHREIQGAKLKHRRIVQQYDGRSSTRCTVTSRAPSSNTGASFSSMTVGRPFVLQHTSDV